MFLRRFALRPSMMMANVKEETTTATGIVLDDLNVVRNAREVLIDLYSKTLNEMKGIPEYDKSRKEVERSTSYRLKVCQEEEDLEKIQKRIGSRDVDELICEAKEDLRLICNKIKWKVWCDPPEPKREIQPGTIPPEFYTAMNSVAIMVEEHEKNKAEERAKKEAKIREEREIVAELTRLLSQRWMKVCQEEEDLEKIEKRIGSGQVDELIVEAKEDHRLICNKKKWKVWSDAPKPKPKIQPGTFPPEFYTFMNIMEERKKKEAEERAKKEAKKRKQREIVDELVRVMSQRLSG